MNSLAGGIRAILKCVASGLLLLSLPLIIVGGWLYAELNWLTQPPGGGDSHLKGLAYVILQFPLLWLVATAWYLVLWLVKQSTFRATFLITMIPALLLPMYVTRLVAGDALFQIAIVAIAVTVAITVASVALSAWGWSKLNAT